MRAYIIHLERAAERRGQVEKIRAALAMPVDIVAAVDGDALSPEEFSSRYRRPLFLPHYPFDLRAGEIACLLSHRKCWELIVASSDDGALIVEDDVSIDAERFAPLLKAVSETAGKDTYVRFPVKSNRESGAIVFKGDGFSLIEPLTPGLGTQCQYVGRDAAAALLAATEAFDRPVDAFLQMKFRHHVRIWSSTPAITSEVSATLGNSLIHARPKPLFGWLRREFLRRRYRWSIAKANRIGASQSGFCGI